MCGWVQGVIGAISLVWRLGLVVNGEGPYCTPCPRAIHPYRYPMSPAIDTHDSNPLCSSFAVVFEGLNCALQGYDVPGGLPCGATSGPALPPFIAITGAIAGNVGVICCALGAAVGTAGAALGPVFRVEDVARKQNCQMVPTPPSHVRSP